MSNAQRNPVERINGATPRRVVDVDARAFFLNELRQARLAAQKDGEAFDQLLFAFERLGLYLLRKQGDLGRYQDALLEFAQHSGLVQQLDGCNTAWHSPPTILYELVTYGRNDALHQGAAVRHLTQHTIELSLLFEDALMNGNTPAVTLRDIMVRCPVTAEQWQPVSFVRQVMLTNSFSFLPVCWNGKWKVLSDVQVAAFLRIPGTGRRQRLGMTVREAASSAPPALVVEDAPFERCDRSINDVLSVLVSHKPILVCEADRTAPNAVADRLVGIVTAFDLL